MQAALTGLAADAAVVDSATLSTGDVAKVLEELETPQELIDRVVELLAACDDARYGGSEADLTAAVEKEFKNSPSGRNPVTLEIKVKNYWRVSAAMGNLIGGSNQVIADVAVKRNEDGSVMGVYQDIRGYYASNSGVIGLMVQAAMDPDIVGIMSDSFADDLRKNFDAD